VIWAKTEAGRTEIQARALVKERARRNLLLLVDGSKSEEMLLGNLSGISADDFQALRALGLIEPVSSSPRGSEAAAGSSAESKAASKAPPASSADAPDAPLGYGEFTATLTRLISSQLGLRGFVLTLAVEKASTNEELQAVAQRTLHQIRDRKGEAAAEAARQALYGA
jgi:hypothetical protein